MNYAQSPEAKEKLNTLLRQYAEYQQASTDVEKDRIGDSMTYADPVVWMMYKHNAYLGGDHEITTVGAFRDHCNDHGGICAKRFDFLARALSAQHHLDINNVQSFPHEMPIEDLYTSEALNACIQDKDLMEQWRHHEYFKTSGAVAKWQNYTTSPHPHQQS
jgi:hypothetical protein